MIKDLSDVYDQQSVTESANPGPGPGPGKGKKAAATPKDLQDNPTYANESKTDVNAYAGYMPSGVYDDRGSREGGLDTIRGENQSFGEKLVRKVANLVPNTAADLVDLVGNVGALMTEWGDQRDYSNAMNDLAAKMKDPFGQVYRHDNSTWAIGDAGWWLDNIGMTAEFAGAFALGGAGIGKILGGIAEGAGDLAGLRAGSMGARILKGAAQLGTSGITSYAMGAQAGAEVFKQTYDNQFNKLIASGMNPDQAKQTAQHIAAQSAASTAQLGTMLTMGLNIGAYAPLFQKSEDVVKDIITKRVAQVENSRMSDIAGAVRGMNAEDYADKLLHHQQIGTVLQNMGSEGLTMMLQHFAKETGVDLGKQGKTDGFLYQFGELEHLLDRTANSEGLLAFAMGAGFGGLQHQFLHNVIPSKLVARMGEDGQPMAKYESDGTTVQQDKNGQPMVQKQWVTPRRYETDFTYKKFSTVKDALASDLESHANTENQFMEAVKKGDPLAINEARENLFAPTRLHAIKYGLTEPFIKSFEGIKGLDNEQVDENGQTQAMKAGYASEPGTDFHQTSADKAITDMQHLSKVYGDLQNHYGTKYQSNEHLEPLVDMVFARMADLHSLKGSIDDARKDLGEKEKVESELAGGLNPAGYSEAIGKYTTDWQSANEVGRQLHQDRQQLRKAVDNNDAATLDRLLKKYRAVGMGDGDVKGAAEDLIGKLDRKHQQMQDRVKTAEESLFASTEYNTWLQDNPDGKFNDYVNESLTRHALSEHTKDLRTQIDEAQSRHDIAAQNLSEITKDRSEKKFMENIGKWDERMRKEAEDVEKQRNAKLAQLAKDRAAANRLKKIDRNKLADHYKGRAQELRNRMFDNSNHVEGWKKELADPETRKDPFRAGALRKLINRSNRENDALDAHARKYDSLENTTRPVDNPADNLPVETEELTGEKTGLTGKDDPQTATTDTSTGDREESIDMNQSDEDLAMALINSGNNTEGETVLPSIEDELQNVQDLLNAGEITHGVEPEVEYKEIVDNIVHPLLKADLENIVNGLIDGTTEFSYDALNEYVAEGIISQSEAANMMAVAKTYADALKNAENAVTTKPLTSTDESQDAPQEQEVHVQDPSAPHTPAINENPKAQDKVPEEASTRHIGLKIVDAATTGAASTIGYDEGMKRNKDGKLEYAKVTKPNELRPTSEDILNPKGLLPNHQIRFEVDTEYDGPKHITDSLSWDADGNVIQNHEKGTDYLNKAGRIKEDKNSEYTPPTNEKEQNTMNEYHPDPRMVGNVPIKAVDASTGKTLFHMRTLDWLEAKFPGTEGGDYRNVVDKIHNEDGTVTDNLSEQRERLMEMRQHIIENFHAGKHTDATIDSKGTGRVILNHQIESKDASTKEIKSSVQEHLAIDRKNPDKSLLPDKKLVLGLVKEGGQVPHHSLNTPFTGKIGFNPKDLVQGTVGAFIPSANGDHMWAPLWGTKLAQEGKPSAAVSTAVRAIELFLQDDGKNQKVTDEIKELESQTGFNLSTARGLKGFLNQYLTYSQDFYDSALSPNAKTSIKAETFLFNVDDKGKGVLDKTKQIKAGVAMRGDGAYYANLVDGKLDPNFVRVLTEGFQQRSRAVVFSDNSLGTKGLNSKGNFYDAVYIPGKDWKFNKYEDYNEFVKSFSRTPVYGHNQLSDGTYVYTANPHLNFSIPDLRQGASIVMENSKPETTVRQDKPAYSSGAAEFDEIFSSSLQPTLPKKVEAIGEGPENSKPLTAQTLRDLYNFTPESQRNGKTVNEVLRDLTDRGHNFLAKGFNPFMNCG